MQAATFELPSSVFEIKWGSYHQPDNHKIDRFRLYGQLWHWHRSSKSDLSEVEMGSTKTLREIAKLFASQNEVGEAMYAQFFCAPRIETIASEGMEDSLPIFPLDAILEEIENVFSKIKSSFLEYGNQRRWMIRRFTYWAPSHFLEGTSNAAHHLFWFDIENLESEPEINLVYINVEMPKDLSAGDYWNSWEVLLRSSGQLILCTAPRGKPAFSTMLDMNAKPDPNNLNPVDFLSQFSESLNVLPNEGLIDAWGHITIGPNADLDSLDLEFLRVEKDWLKKNLN